MAITTENKAMVNLALGAIVLFLAFKVFQYKNFTDNVIVKFKNFRLDGNIFNPQGILTLTIVNPSNLAITVNSVVGQINYKDQKIANVYMEKILQIPPTATVDIDLNLNAAFTDLITIIKAAIAKTLVGQISFMGTVTVNNFPLPINMILA